MERKPGPTRNAYRRCPRLSRPPRIPRHNTRWSSFIPVPNNALASPTSVAPAWSGSPSGRRSRRHLAQRTSDRAQARAGTSASHQGCSRTALTIRARTSCRICRSTSESGGKLSRRSIRRIQSSGAPPDNPPAVSRRCSAQAPPPPGPRLRLPATPDTSGPRASSGASLP